MPSPFPGMDPYLEDPRLWSAVHHALLSNIQDQLAPLLRPRYVIRPNERAYLTADGGEVGPDRIPDVHVVVAPDGGRLPTAGGAMMTADPVRVIDLFEQETHEFFLEITNPQDGSVVTVIEVLSPSNKARGSQGRASFLHKRREVYATPAHWMEIDLLRAGARTTDPSPPVRTEYRTFLSRGGDPREEFVWPMPLRERLPKVRVPLRGSDPEVPLDLQAAIDHVVVRGGYDITFRYDHDPPPPMSPDNLNWCRDRIGAWRAHRAPAG